MKEEGLIDTSNETPEETAIEPESPTHKFKISLENLKPTTEDDDVSEQQILNSKENSDDSHGKNITSITESMLGEDFSDQPSTSVDESNFWDKSPNCKISSTNSTEIDVNTDEMKKIRIESAFELYSEKLDISDADLASSTQLKQSYLDHIQSLTDSIKESQEREIQRFDKLLNDDIDFQEEQEQMAFISSTIREDTRNHNPTSRPREFTISDAEILNRSSQLNLDHRTKLYSEHFRRKEKYDILKEMQEKERKQKRNESKVNSVSHELLRKKEEINLFTLYGEAVEEFDSLNKDALNKVFQRIGVFLPTKNENIKKRDNDMLNYVWSIISNDASSIEFTTFQKYLSLIVDPKSSSIVKKLNKQEIQKIEDYPPEFLEIAPKLIQSVATHRLIQPTKSKFTPCTKQLMEEKKREETFRPQIINYRSKKNSSDYQSMQRRTKDHCKTLHEIHATNQQNLHKKMKHQENIREAALKKECTFRPQITKLENSAGDGEENIFEALHAATVQNFRIEGCETTEEMAIKEHCTFQPNLQKRKTKYVQVNPLRITGFQKHIKNRRKILIKKKQESNSLDKKIMSYSQQYDQRMKREKKNKRKKMGYAEIYKKIKEPIFDEVQNSNDKNMEPPEVIYLNIALSPTQSTRITLRPGDNPRHISLEFARVWGISSKKRNLLERTLSAQIDRLNQDRNIFMKSILVENEKQNHQSSAAAESYLEPKLPMKLNIKVAKASEKRDSTSSFSVSSDDMNLPHYRAARADDLSDPSTEISTPSFEFS